MMVTIPKEISITGHRARHISPGRDESNAMMSYVDLNGFQQFDQVIQSGQTAAT